MELTERQIAASRELPDSVHPPTPANDAEQRGALSPDHRNIKLAERLYRVRRLRDDFFPADLFAEPAWDILLLLYSVERTRKRLSVSAVCFSAGAPQTTVLRWIDKLIDAGILRRQKHPTDGRMSWLRLTKETVAKLDDYCERALATCLHDRF